MYSPQRQNIDEFIKHQELILPVVQNYLSFNNLDIGCGNGITSVIHHEKLGINPTLCDVVDIRSEMARQFPFQLITDGNLPFTDRFFGSSYLQYVLHHIPSDKVLTLLKEAGRVSERVVIVEEVRTDNTDLSVALDFDYKVNEMIHPNIHMQVYQYFSMEEIVGILHSIGRREIYTFNISSGTEENGWIDTWAIIA